MTRKLRMGCVSFEHGHQYGWMSAMLRLPNVELVAVSEPDPQLRARADTQIAAYDRAAWGYDPDQGAVRIFTRHEDVIGRADIDAVSICAANAQHHPLALAAAAAGKHVMCEKPLAISIDQATDMVRACHVADVKLGLAHPVRHAAPCWEAKQRLQSGELGAIRAMNLTNVLGASTTGWFIDPERSGGGAIRDHIVHATDLMRWFSGREVEAVYCEADTRMRDIQVDDTGMLIEVFEGGLVGSCDPSWNRPTTWPMWGDVTGRILCERGVVEFDVTGDYVALTAAADSPTHRRLSVSASMDTYLLADFAAAVLEDREPCANGRDGWAGVACTEAAYESARTHRFVEVARYEDYFKDARPGPTKATRPG